MKDIKGFEGLYAITSCGKVWSHRSQKFLKAANDGRGYLYVCLKKNGKQKAIKVHRLVAEAYLPNPDNLPCVNHKDEDKTNNCVNNLEWCTYYYNHHYGTKIERAAKALWKKVRCIETGEVFNSQKEAAEKYGLSQGNISRVCRGKAKTTGGYRWEFVTEGIQ